MTVGIPRRTLRLGLFAVTTAFFGFLSGGAAEADEGLTPPADVAADLRHDRIAFG